MERDHKEKIVAFECDLHKSLQDKAVLTLSKLISKCEIIYFQVLTVHLAFMSDWAAACSFSAKLNGMFVVSTNQT